jgi:uncharacterized LabA/DUF88 family protein
MNTYVYVDGFNLYYAIRNTPYKWLNLKLLADGFLAAGHVVQRVKYYTAYVSGAHDPNDPRHQQMYLRALKTVPEVEAYFGSFMAKTMWRPLSVLPIAGRQFNPGASTLAAHDYSVAPKAPYPNPDRMNVGTYGGPFPKSPAVDTLKVHVHTMEEKGSDVNLAVHLVNDAWKGAFDAAAVLSNDTDLVEPIRIVTQELKKPVVLLCPSPKGVASSPLTAVATSTRQLNPAILKAAQFPDNVPIPAGKNWKPIIKPANW